MFELTEDQYRALKKIAETQVYDNHPLSGSNTPDETFDLVRLGLVSIHMRGPAGVLETFHITPEGEEMLRVNAVRFE